VPREDFILEQPSQMQRVLTLAESCKGRSTTTEVSRFKLIENKKRAGSKQQRVVVVGGEFHSTDGFSEGAGRAGHMLSAVQGEWQG